MIEAGERDAERIRQRMHGILSAERLAKPEYVSVADGRTLRELDDLAGDVLLSLAVRFGETRLIDNVPLKVP